jgi:acetoacetyl-CoA synthetase
MPEGKLLWQPTSASIRKTNMYAYQKWLEKRGHSFEGYQQLWEWSVDDIEGFWGSIWKYFDVADADYPVLPKRKMPGARWFLGAELNLAEKVFREKRDGVAIISKAERGSPREVTWRDLERKTAAFASKLREMGVKKGDRVAGYLPNIPEAAMAFLASASLGATWSSCAPEFGAPAVIDRFSQIEPKVLVAADGYQYGGKWVDRKEELERILKGLPTVKRVVEVQSGKSSGIQGAIPWDDAVDSKAEFDFEFVPFAHPLWILYSSGTTGLPKAIVHSQGGILVELLKVLALHNDIRVGDRFFWYTTTGWMMWNYLVGGLLHGSTIVLYSGNPNYPSPDSLWEFMEKAGTTFVGTSAAYIASAMKSGVEPRTTHNLRNLRGMGSTGSPLSRESFEWVYSSVKEDLWLASVSGGTDVCTAFVGGSPTLPVHAGEIQCRALGAKVEAYDEEGRPVVGKVGELVVTEPMPSMPVYLWGDSDGSRYLESYFGVYPGVWRHGDWIEITKRGTCIIFGRSDATIKRLGVRIGTSEIYRTVESLEEVADSMAIDLEGGGNGNRLILFVVTAHGKKLDDELGARIRAKVRSDLSPRYVPDDIIAVPSIPRTLNGKKLEVPVKRLLMGGDPSKVLSKDAIADPESVDFYVELARNLKKSDSHR